MTGDIVGMAWFDICLFAPDSAIASVYFLGKVSGVLMLSIKLILGVPILILFIISPNPHSYLFFLPTSIFLWQASYLCIGFFEEHYLLPWVKLISQPQQ